MATHSFKLSSMVGYDSRAYNFTAGVVLTVGGVSAGVIGLTHPHLKETLLFDFFGVGALATGIAKLRNTVLGPARIRELREARAEGERKKYMARREQRQRMDPSYSLARNKQLVL